MISYLPTKAFQMHQIFAANTNVGKTIFSTALCRGATIASSRNSVKKRIFYLKPIQTGYPQDSDARHVETYSFSSVTAKTLYTYPDPVSPHIATTKPPSDSTVLSTLRSSISSLASSGNGNLFLETAGGVHSPIMSGTPQCDFYRPLRLPTILIGDSNLGGISTTMTAYEALRLRGYDLDAILLFDNTKYKNHIYLERNLDGLDVSIVPLPPRPLDDKMKEEKQMHAYYAQIDDVLIGVVKRLEMRHLERFERLESMAEKGKEILWWPFTQHKNVKDVTVIDSAHGDLMTTYSNSATPEVVKDNGWFNEQFDGCASWWTQGLGHSNPKLALASARAAGRYGHVIFPECVHEPALGLAEKLLSTVGKNWASRVFYSDNGSTAMEVGFKMGLKASLARYGWDNNDSSIKGSAIEIVGIDGSYHGDTIGAMDACGPNVYNAQVQWYEPKGYWFAPPTIQLKEGVYHLTLPWENMTIKYPSLSALFDKQRWKNDTLKTVYEVHIRTTLENLVRKGRRFGALVMEPLLMGAGGMILVDPLFQRTLVEVVRGMEFGESTNSHQEWNWPGLPVIFDEVFTGFWRLGYQSAAEMIDIKPDIASYAKLLTGGLVPLSVTLTTSAIFDIFLSDDKPNALLHGHSYTAHPIGCEVSKTSVEELERMEREGVWNLSKLNWGNEYIWSMWSLEAVTEISHLSTVEGVIAIGSVLAIELKDSMSKGYSSNVSKNIIHSLREHCSDHTPINIFTRPLGNVIYLMASQISTSERLRGVEGILLRCLKNEMK